MLVVWMFVWSSTGPCQLPRSSSLYMEWYLVAPGTACQDAVTVPSARVTLTDETAPGGGGVYGPTVGESVHSLQPLSFQARTPTMMLFALSALNVMLVV